MHKYSDDGSAGELPERTVFPIPYGWVLNAVAAIDEVSPGFMRQVCRARLTWRQGLWATLSMGCLDSPDFLIGATGEPHWVEATREEIVRGFALVAVSMSARELIEVSFGSCPSGFLGALRKLHGEAPTQPDFYSLLHGVFMSSDPIDRLRAKSLEQVGGLNESRVEAALLVSDPALLIPAIVMGFHSVDAAKRAEEQVAAVRKLVPSLSDKDISEAFRAGRQHFKPWFRSLLMQATPMNPLPTDNEPDFERITGSNAKALGIAMQNCLDEDLVMPRSLSGVWSMVLWKPESLILELRLYDLAWCVSAIHRAKNAEVAPSHVALVADRVRALGIICPVPVEPEEKLKSLTSAFGSWRAGEIWDFDF